MFHSLFPHFQMLCLYNTEKLHAYCEMWVWKLKKLDIVCFKVCSSLQVNKIMKNFGYNSRASGIDSHQVPPEFEAVLCGNIDLKTC